MQFLTNKKEMLAPLSGKQLEVVVTIEEYFRKNSQVPNIFHTLIAILEINDNINHMNSPKFWGIESVDNTENEFDVLI